MIMFEGMTQLDLTGPLEVFSRFPENKIHLISKTVNPVKCDRNLTIIPDTSFEDCPAKLDVLFVPGGPGVSGLLKDIEYLDFIRSKKDSTYITSVCTGSIVLAACGLLNGFKATTYPHRTSRIPRYRSAECDLRFPPLSTSVQGPTMLLTWQDRLSGRSRNVGVPAPADKKLRALTPPC